MGSRVPVEKVVCMRCARARTGGFTLIEILVVLAILVILFSLLIVPLISGLDMASRGRRALTLHDAARATLQRIRADLHDAVYVYPTTMVEDPNNPGTYWANTSQVMFVPPEREASGQIIEPLRHALVADWDAAPPGSTNVQRTICIGVQSAFAGRPYNEDNPFVLVRRQGKCAYDPTTGEATFDELPGSGRDTLTPKRGFDILPAWWLVDDPSSALYGDTGTQYPTPADPHYDEQLLCVFKGFEVLAKRITGEVLQPDSSSLVYRALNRSWDGRPIVYPPLDLSLQPEPLVGQPRELDATDFLYDGIDPRIAVLRFVSDAASDLTLDPRDGDYTNVVYDSFETGLRDADLDLRYDLTTGEVIFGAIGWAARDHDNPIDADGDGTTDDGLYPLPTGMSVDGAWAFIVQAPAPAAPAPDKFTKIIPERVRVWVQRLGAAGYSEYTRTDEQNPDEIGRREFHARPISRTGDLELRFNRYRFALRPNGNVTFGRMAVQYVYRRNFARIDMRVLDPTGASGDEVFDVDDRVIVDYSTRKTLTAMLELSDVISQDDPSLPPTQVLQSARLTAEIDLRNLGA